METLLTMNNKALNHTYRLIKPTDHVKAITRSATNLLDVRRRYRV